MTISDKTDLLFAALVKCQGNIEGATKDSTNPVFKSKYADLSSVMDACRGPMKDAGLALSISLQTADKGVSLTPMLVHSSGQFIAYDPFTVLVTKQDAQGQGSAVSYGRRYLTMSLLGISAEDDDGNAASQPKAPSPKPMAESTHRKEVLAHLTAIKGQLGKAQVDELSKDILHAGTTDAMLDAVKAKADKFLSLNIDASAAAMAAGFGGEVEA